MGKCDRVAFIFLDFNLLCTRYRFGVSFVFFCLVTFRITKSVFDPFSEEEDEQEGEAGV